MLICVMLILSVLVTSVDVARAVNPDERLDDPVLEQRARNISKELRCLQCQNQSIDDSNAGFSKDMRLLVRERLVAGDSDEEVVDYIVRRYGAFALLRPAFSGRNLALWLGPAVVFMVALVAILWRLRQTQALKSAGSAPLSEAEISEIEDILTRRNSGRHNSPEEGPDP